MRQTVILPTNIGYAKSTTHTIAHNVRNDKLTSRFNSYANIFIIWKFGYSWYLFNGFRHFERFKQITTIKKEPAQHLNAYFKQIFSFGFVKFYVNILNVIYFLMSLGVS